MASETLFHSHYDLLEKIGEGGMGVVYKGRDRNLGRSVAIKVLSAELMRDDGRRRRFEQEARTASALNHPNIITIHDIITGDKAECIVMEYVDGPTLHTLIAKKGLRLAEALKLSIQIADALAAAHRAGILHRDLKPANIMISGRGVVKLLDFGLAKVARKEGADQGETVAFAEAGPRTEPGVLLGTVGYMSPEQVDCQEVDARSDIFSFGAVLYEMITRRAPFQRQSAISTLSAILREDPPSIRQLVGELPGELDRIIARCLRKDPERRFQHMEDVKVALLEAQEDLGSALPASAPPARVRRNARWLLPAFFASVAAAGALAVFWWTGARQRGPEPALLQLTWDTGLTTDPALSADGTLLAYASDRANGESLDVYVQQTAGSQPLRLTTHPRDDHEPAFSPDGRTVAFRSERDGGGVYVLPALGGPERLIAPGGRRPCFSPDGAWIAYTAGEPWVQGCRVYVSATRGSATRQICPEFVDARFPIWLPDSRHLIFQGTRSRSDPETERVDWWTASLEGCQAVRSGAANAFNKVGLQEDEGPGAWLPPRGPVLFGATLGSARNLWYLPVSPSRGTVSGPAGRLTAGSARETLPVAAGGGRIAFSSMAEQTSIWAAAPAPNSGQPLARVPTNSVASGMPSLSADGRLMAYRSNRSGKPEIDVFDFRTQTAVTLADSGAGEFPPRRPCLSPDGSKVAYSIQDRAAKWSIRMMAAAGGPAETLCSDCGAATALSARGELVLVWAAGKIEALETASRARSVVLQHSRYGLYGAGLSPDDRWIVFQARISAERRQIFVAPLHRGRPALEAEWMALTDGATWEGLPVWNPNGRSVYFLSDRDGSRCIWARAVDAATAKPGDAAYAVRHFHSARQSLVRVDPDFVGIALAKDKLVFALSELTANVWLAALRPGWPN